MKTTLNQIRQKGPCQSGWEKLLRHLGKNKADDESLEILTILDSNGLDDALWCLRAVQGHDKEIRLYAVWCAQQIQHLMTDSRSTDAIKIAERYANGAASKSELAAARAAARDVDLAAARDAASAAAKDAAWAAASDAARAAANAAASAEAKDAAWAAARDAASAAQQARLRVILSK